jgi:predicted GNAT family N-acyltransferase
LSAPDYLLEEVAWSDARDALSLVRRTVFVVEQGVPEALEWEDDDGRATHLLARAATGEAIGTGRLLADARIGRMAVLPEWRCRGIGGAILARLIGIARVRGHRSVHLHAQTHALGFYRRYGFVAEGDEFMEAGIPHRAMRLTLDR